MTVIELLRRCFGKPNLAQALKQLDGMQYWMKPNERVGYAYDVPMGALWLGPNGEHFVTYANRLYTRNISGLCLEWRCDICGARSEESRTERCRGACQRV